MIMKQASKTRLLVESSAMIALAVVLDAIKINSLPYGGSTTLASMLPILLIGLKNGPKWGFGTAFVYSAIQLFLSLGKISAWGLSAKVFIVCILFDYLVAYSVLGFASFFGRSSRLRALIGAAFAMLLRFLSHFITGITIWATWADGFRAVMLYSLGYNSTFMVPEFILTMVVMVLLTQVTQVRRLIGLAR